MGWRVAGRSAPGQQIQISVRQQTFKIEVCLLNQYPTVYVLTDI
jgi:hypothetical protein